MLCGTTYSPTCRDRRENDTAGRPAPVLGLLSRYIASQDPDKAHTPLTRLLVSAIILFANLVLYGFYGLLATVVMYLVGVELIGLNLAWSFLPLGLAIAMGCWFGIGSIVDYWRNYGHGP